MKRWQTTDPDEYGFVNVIDLDTGRFIAMMLEPEQAQMIARAPEAEYWKERAEALEAEMREDKETIDRMHARANRYGVVPDLPPEITREMGYQWRHIAAGEVPHAHAPVVLRLIGRHAIGKCDGKHGGSACSDPECINERAAQHG